MDFGERREGLIAQERHEYNVSEDSIGLESSHITIFPMITHNGSHKKLEFVCVEVVPGKVSDNHMSLITFLLFPLER